MLINDGKYTWITQWRREQIERGGGLDLSKIVTPVKRQFNYLSYILYPKYRNNSFFFQSKSLRLITE